MKKSGKARRTAPLHLNGRHDKSVMAPYSTARKVLTKDASEVWRQHAILPLWSRTNSPPMAGHGISGPMFDRASRRSSGEPPRHPTTGQRHGRSTVDLHGTVAKPPPGTPTSPSASPLPGNGVVNPPPRTTSTPYTRRAAIRPRTKDSATGTRPRTAARRRAARSFP